MANDSSIIVDCVPLAGAFVFSPETGSRWSMSEKFEMYQGTSWRTQTNQSNFAFTFEGTSVAFIGVNVMKNQSTVQIDNGTMSGMGYDDNPGYYKTWFQSTKLSDGQHTITVRNLNNAEIDFAIVEVGDKTPLFGKTIVVDNDSPSIRYSGHWSRNTSQVTGTNFMAFPYGNSTHRSSTPGDTFTLRFTGSSISVYGVFSSNRGNISMTFTVDDKVTVSQTYNQTDMSYRETLNFLYYSSVELAAGEHTLIVNVTEVNNKTFMLDYITYTPSFATLASINNATSKITSVSVSSFTSSGNLPSDTSQPLPTASIVGGVIGVLALGVLVVTMGLFLRRRKAKQAGNVSQYLGAPADERSYQNVPDANNRDLIMPRKHQRQQPSGTMELSNLRPQYHSGIVKRGRSNPAAQAGPFLPAPPNPHSNIDRPLADAEIGTEPPPYDTLSDLVLVPNLLVPNLGNRGT